jgi:hypothetical protein
LKNTLHRFAPRWLPELIWVEKGGRYDGFLSCAHADAALAEEIQRVLHRIAKPWYKLRARRIFRDTLNLSVARELWTDLEKHLYTILNFGPA